MPGAGGRKGAAGNQSPISPASWPAPIAPVWRPSIEVPESLSANTMGTPELVYREPGAATAPGERVRRV